MQKVILDFLRALEHNSRVLDPERLDDFKKLILDQQVVGFFDGILHEGQMRVIFNNDALVSKLQDFYRSVMRAEGTESRQIHSLEDVFNSLKTEIQKEHPLLTQKQLDALKERAAQLMGSIEGIAIDNAQATDPQVLAKIHQMNRQLQNEIETNIAVSIGIAFCLVGLIYAVVSQVSTN